MISIEIRNTRHLFKNQVSYSRRRGKNEWAQGGTQFPNGLLVGYSTSIHMAYELQGGIINRDTKQ